MSWDQSKQIEHCAFHLAKISALFSTCCEKMHPGEPYDVDKLVAERVPDILISVTWSLDPRRPDPIYWPRG